MSNNWMALQPVALTGGLGDRTGTHPSPFGFRLLALLEMKASKKQEVLKVLRYVGISTVST